MKKKIIFLQSVLLHYRIPFYVEMSKHYDVTVLHSGKQILPADNHAFNEIIVPRTKIGPFYFQKGVLSFVSSNQFDFVIAMFDLRWVTYLFLRLIRFRNPKFMWWGLDSGKHLSVTKMKVLLANLTHDPIVFYSDRTRNRMHEFGVRLRNTFVANNTFHVPRSLAGNSAEKRNLILSSGSFDKRKQNDVLLQAFAKALPVIPKDIRLVFIGDGTEEQNIKNLCHDLNLDQRVDFVGRIESVDQLANFYSKSIASASFGQAGLAVLQSLGFGVPYITKKNAVSGGEIDNITSSYNGILCEDSLQSLTDSLVLVCNDEAFAHRLRVNAKKYYEESCTVENMAHGFILAIQSLELNP